MCTLGHDRKSRSTTFPPKSYNSTIATCIATWRVWQVRGLRKSKGRSGWVRAFKAVKFRTLCSGIIGTFLLVPVRNLTSQSSKASPARWEKPLEPSKVPEQYFGVPGVRGFGLRASSGRQRMCGSSDEMSDNRLPANRQAAAKESTLNPYKT